MFGSFSYICTSSPIIIDLLFLNFGYYIVVDRVFRGDCPTKQLYDQGAKEIALSVVNGINCKCILFY